MKYGCLTGSGPWTQTRNDCSKNIARGDGEQAEMNIHLKIQAIYQNLIGTFSQLHSFLYFSEGLSYTQLQLFTYLSACAAHLIHTEQNKTAAYLCLPTTYRSHVTFQVLSKCMLEKEEEGGVEVAGSLKYCVRRFYFSVVCDLDGSMLRF